MRLAWTTFLTGLGVVAVVGCASIIGADDDKVLRTDDGGTGISELADAGEGDASACKTGEKLCSGACVSMTAPEFGCGAADCTPCSLPNTAVLACTPDGKCTAGKCRPGFGACGPATNGCTDDLSKPATCQGCLTACGAAAPKCAPTGCVASCGALSDCSGACVDTKTSPTNCGACGNVCPATANGDPTCSNGSCTADCRQGYGHCDGNPNGPCVPLTVYYPDQDGDGYGDSSKPKPACSQAAAGQGYIAQGGDCHDGNNKVHPGQTSYFDQGYTTPTGAVSYDYNCDGVEAEQSGVAHFTACGAPPSCATPPSAYLPNGQRSGAGVNNYCGSQRYAQCGAEGSNCDTNSTSAPNPNRCR